MRPSDVGLKKFLRARGIATPPQGHWNKFHADRSVKKPPKIPPRQPEQTGRIRLDRRFHGLIEEASPIPVEGQFASAAVPEDLEELRAHELKAIGKVGVLRNLDKPHTGLAQLLMREAEIRRKAEADRWYRNRPAFDTPLGQHRTEVIAGYTRPAHDLPAMMQLSLSLDCKFRTAVKTILLLRIVPTTIE